MILVDLPKIFHFLSKAKNIGKIELEYDLKDTIQILHYIYIFKNENNQDKISQKDIQNFIRLVRFSGTANLKQMESEIKETKNKTISRFGSDKEYGFIPDKSSAIKNRNLFDTQLENKYKEKYSIEQMLDSAFSSLVTYFIINLEKHPDKISKEYLSVVICKSLMEFRDKLSPKNKNKLKGKYKLYSITAFILNELGYKISTKKNPINKQLFNDIKYLLDTNINKKSTK